MLSSVICTAVVVAVLTVPILLDRNDKPFFSNQKGMVPECHEGVKTAYNPQITASLPSLSHSTLMLQISGVFFISQLCHSLFGIINCGCGFVNRRMGRSWYQSNGKPTHRSKPALLVVVITLKSSQKLSASWEKHWSSLVYISF